ncbi:MAG: helix-turn-helix domain-containing protein, partial [Firmicutes bacterium]|nr:helix-turn-helix domain-containing protein [Bacillota bacterium]
MDGSRLKEARRARNLTQAELGRLVGVGKSAISQYEHGLRLPETAVLARLAEALGVSADWLLGIEDRRGTIAGEARTPYRTGAAPPEDEDGNGFLAEL